MKRVTDGPDDMQVRTFAIMAAATLALAGCSGGGNAMSRLNPFTWFGGGAQAPDSLAPDGGYPTVREDNTHLLARVLSARWEPLYEGRMLVVTGLPATKGWWATRLVTERPMPEGRLRGDENGVLQLRLVGLPPLDNSFPASAAAQAPADVVTVGMTLPHEALASIREVVITGAGNSIALRR